jgi:sulfhydrogenase subunit beta (sulfur reductase)
LLAANCTEPGGTCFCASMNTGPRAKSGFDLVLTEMLDRGRHCFLVEVGSSRGADALHGVRQRVARDDAIAAAERLNADATRRMGRSLDTKGIQELLYEHVEHPHWEHVASRCLACGNCTLVCPTCFCTTVEDTTNITGDVAERRRKWDSCFFLDFSYIHKGPVRSSATARYRHWITHKFATWIEQFGSSCCVGCGRCITWCPVGIDGTEEIRRLWEETARVAEERETGHVGYLGNSLGTPDL